MKSKIMILQTSAFVDKHIEPSTSLISTLSKAIKEISDLDFLPSLQTTLSYNINTGVTSPVNNLNFVTSDKLFQIIFVDNRVDVCFNYKDEEALSNGIEFNEQSEMASKILQALLNGCGLKSNRFAINIDILSDLITNITNTKFSKNMVSQLSYYQGKNLYDWISRANVNDSVDINGFLEKLNIITEISEAFNNQKTEKRVHCHIDINTVPENNNFRFSSQDYVPFLVKAQSVIETIVPDFENLNVEK